MFEKNLIIVIVSPKNFAPCKKEEVCIIYLIDEYTKKRLYFCFVVV